MKKRVLALLLAFTLVMPMFAVTALANVALGEIAIVYNNDGDEAVGVEIISIGSIVLGDQNSIQAYLTDDEPNAEFDRDANFARTTWIEQFGGATLPSEFADFPLGLVPGEAEHGDWVSVWINSDFVGAAEIILEDVPIDPPVLTAAVVGEDIVYHTDNADGIDGLSVSIGYTVVIDGDKVVVYNNNLIADVVAIDTILAAIKEDLEPDENTDVYIWIRLNGVEEPEWQQVGDTFTVVVEPDVLVPAESATINKEFLNAGAKFNVVAEFKLDLDPPGSDASGLTITSMTPSVLQVYYSDANSYWEYVGVRSGTSIVQIRGASGLISDMQIVRVLP